MKWDHVRVFLAVARHNRLSTAGKYLSLDTSTVGRHIDQLETDLRAKLFDRSPQGYALTPDGERLVSMAEAMEKTALHIQDEVSGQSQALSGPIRIGAPEGISNYVLTDAAHRFCEEHPKIQLQLVALPRHFSLSKREADIAITVSPPETGRLKVQKIADYELFLYTTDAAIERFGPVHCIEDLLRVRGIGYIPDLIFDDALNYIPLVGPDITPHLTSASLLVQVRWATSGAGVCILPNFIAEQHPELKPILTDKIHFRRTFYLIQHQDMAGVTKIKRAVEFFVEHTRDRLRAVNRSTEG